MLILGIQKGIAKRPGLISSKINEKYNGVDWKILSEENVKISSENYDLNSDWVWILDPLDGTKDFIQGTENYAMHLALNYKKSLVWESF